VDRRFTVDGNELAAHLSLPSRTHARAQPGVVIAHGFPAEVGGGANSTKSFPELADRIAAELGWVALAYASRGVDDSEGDFSLEGWLRDLAGAVDHLDGSVRCDGLWIIGFGTGGSLAIVVAADDPRIRGVATLASPADFSDWADDPRLLLAHAREIGIIRDPKFPDSIEDWEAELTTVRADSAAERLDDRELLLIHGSADEVVPVFDARTLDDAYAGADLRIVPGGAHHLRHDPRAISVLFGWLDRQRAVLLAEREG
jgi:alpha/beta superfamily hydrolase